MPWKFSRRRSYNHLVDVSVEERINIDGVDEIIRKHWHAGSAVAEDTLGTSSIFAAGFRVKVEAGLRCDYVANVRLG